MVRSSVCPSLSVQITEYGTQYKRKTGEAENMTVPRPAITFRPSPLSIAYFACGGTTTRARRRLATSRNSTVSARRASAGRGTRNRTSAPSFSAVIVDATYAFTDGFRDSKYPGTEYEIVAKSYGE